MTYEGAKELRDSLVARRFTRRQVFVHQRELDLMKEIAKEASDYRRSQLLCLLEKRKASLEKALEKQACELEDALFLEG